MKSTLTLIEKAAEVCGGQNALAKKLGFSSGTLSDMKHGRKAVSPATAAELADIAGVDVDYAVKLAVLESVKGTRREAKLREILGKGLAAGAVAMLATSYSSAANASSGNEAGLSRGLNNVYIVFNSEFATLMPISQPTRHALCTICGYENPPHHAARWQSSALD